MKPGIVVLCCDGLYQRYLISRIAEEFTLLGVVLHATPHAKGTLVSRLWRYRNPVELLRYIHARLAWPGFERRVRGMSEALFYRAGSPPALPPNVPIVEVGDVNDPRAVSLVLDARPDIVCVNGTNLLRKPMLDAAAAQRHGAINLHTGLSPYSRGGNCNLHMLLEGRPEMVGLTIHHLDAGIDSGDIIITARPNLDADDSFEIIEAKVFRLGIDLMLVAVRQIQEGRAGRVKQWEEGKLFLRRTGYVFKPYLHVKVNRMLKAGLLARYLGAKDEIDRSVRTVGAVQ